MFECCSAGGEVTLSGLVGPPTAALCPPGQCVFNEEWSPAQLVERQQITHEVILCTFALRDATKPMGLSTCACILSKFNEEGSPDPIVRPYTPVSTNALIGKFQLAVKVYPGGKMSEHMKNLPIGEDIDFKHIAPNVKIQHPFGKKTITMLVGGTGVTPMIQALHAVLGTESDTTQVTMLFGNKTQKDILCKELLETWAENSGGRFKIVHVLSDAKDDATWKGETGFITKEMLAKHAAPASDDTLVVVCGPPPMYNAFCGPRDKKELTGMLADMGYSAEQVFKF
ncbi:unnamed protein product [Polarella glacialis]|uniref:NADH-cytochrome b5 reductase n=1 Tax=Polarella glacialis TaxID=89957 RepID=A0A813D098_POLGL|nr:unnamed protein product [Polarella glacialis]